MLAWVLVSALLRPALAARPRPRPLARPCASDLACSRLARGLVCLLPAHRCSGED